jgi:saccharopine dehydrogenase-like NADP-dependent oxidoreductase
MKTSNFKKSTIAVLGGAGAMGRATVFELARSGYRILILESDREAALRIAKRYGFGRATVLQVDARKPEALADVLKGTAAVVHCAPYTMNLSVMEAALLARVHYLDLGGLFHTTRLQLPKDPDFRRISRLAVLGIGSAPGIMNVLARAAADPLKSVRAIRVYNGGADFTAYEAPVAFGFSPATVLDEFTLPPMVFEKGKFKATNPLTGGEDYAFEGGAQRVHLSLHSEVATLPLSYAAKGIKECTFKIAYDKTLIERLKLLIDLGLTDKRAGPRGVAPRDVLLDAFKRLPPPPDVVDDRDFLSVVVEGEDAQGEVEVRYDLLATPQARPPLSAVARDTGFPPALVVDMILSGVIKERGVLPPERCIPVAPFLAALAARGLKARKRVTRPA